MTTAEDGQVAAMEMFFYANQMAADRKANPRNDLVSVLMAAEVDGEKLSEADFDGFFILLTVAGNETTRNLISGAMLALIEHPDQRQRLHRRSVAHAARRRGVPALGLAADLLPPHRHRRCRDPRPADQGRREGRHVLPLRQPRRGRLRERRDVRRRPRANPHIAFGGTGPHFCLGASLARLEIRCMFEELLARLPDMELAAPPSRLRSNFINGIKHMPVKFTPR